MPTVTPVNMSANLDRNDTEVRRLTVKEVNMGLKGVLESTGGSGRVNFYRDTNQNRRLDDEDLLFHGVNVKANGSSPLIARTRAGGTGITFVEFKSGNKATRLQLKGEIKEMFGNGQVIEQDPLTGGEGGSDGETDGGALPLPVNPTAPTEIVVYHRFDPLEVNVNFSDLNINHTGEINHNITGQVSHILTGQVSVNGKIGVDGNILFSNVGELCSVC